MRAVIYARYSSDLQSDASIEDQIRLCEERLKSDGASLTNCFTDHGISAASTLLRPGVQMLMQEAMQGKFDVLYAEALDRISRDQEDIAAIFKRLSFSGVKIITLAEGEVSELHIGLKGTMNALFLKDLADKTRRGLRGRVEKGKSGGGKAYGYDKVNAIQGNGEPVTGERRINKSEALIVRRIFEDYVAGKSPKAIAVQLNKEGVPGPSGKSWGQSTINGNRQRGTGILNNELYVGRMVWNRLTYVKDPDTGKRVSRLNPEDEWVIRDVPELRIVDQLSWDAVKAKQGELNRKDTALWQKNRPKNLLSGLVKCGSCGGGFSMVSKTHLGCSTARNKGTCDNRSTIKRTEVEASVLGALQQHLMDAELCAEFCKEYTRHQNELRSRHNAALNGYRREMAKLRRDQEKLVQSILDGVPGAALKEQGEYIVKRKEELETILASTQEAPVLFHPNIADRYHKEVTGLIDALNAEDHRQEAAQLIRKLIDKIELQPIGGEERLAIDLHGDLAGILSVATSSDSTLVEGGLSYINPPRLDDDNGLNVASQEALVAGVGFEPTTFRL